MDRKISSGGAPRIASVPSVAGAAVLSSIQHGSSSCTVSLTSSPNDWCLELREGSAACCGLKKEASLEIPMQKSTISLIAAVWAGAE
ncbi:hypothetical protein P7K49_032094, partial [Saguinus oedipus]